MRALRLSPVLLACGCSLGLLAPAPPEPPEPVPPDARERLHAKLEVAALADGMLAGRAVDLGAGELVIDGYGAAPGVQRLRLVPGARVTGADGRAARELPAPGAHVRVFYRSAEGGRDAVLVEVLGPAEARTLDDWAHGLPVGTGLPPTVGPDAPGHELR